ncbi:DUF2381 family protein [Archangium sp.]|jgi:uncharacterized protein (TIGR02268 family)|uniref:DUF2381 family protein n=1 Tax=Archangium sp. TaxID=1872627 RepID=UPI002ED9AC91
MFAPLPAAPVLLALLATTPALVQPAAEDTGTARHLELTADTAGQVHEVGLGPDQPTTLVFNAPLQPGSVEVEDERVVTVAKNEARGMVTLLLSGEPMPDKPLWLTVRFADGAAPGSVTFRLVRSTRAEAQVRVNRRPSSGDSLWREARRERERAERCEAELTARPRVDGPRPEGLTGLFDAGLVGQGQGIEARKLEEDAPPRPDEPLQVWKTYSYRAGGRLAVELEVENTGSQPWTVDEKAELVSTEGARPRVLGVWPREPLAPGKTRWLFVEAEATKAQARGTFRLVLGEAGGARTLTVRGVTFP